MRYTLPAIAAVLVVTATVAVGTPALSPATPPAPAARNTPDATATSIATVGNTSNYLELPSGDTRSRFGNASLDLGAAVAADSARLQETLAIEAGVERFRSAPNSSAKTAVLRAVTSDIENRTAALRRYQRRTIRQFSDGRISAEVVFRRFAVIDARARAIEDSAIRMQGIAQFTPQYTIPFDISNRLINARERAGLFYTDQRENVRASLVGRREAKRYLVRAGGSGIVLANVDSRRQSYTREAFVDDRWRRGGSDRFDGDIGAALDFVYDLYPWAAEDENQRGPDADIDSMLESIYKVSITHRHGELLTYLDGSTAEIFMEVQDKRLPRLPIAGTVGETNATADLTVRVNLTHPTGPMEVAVRDATTGAPVDARIRVDGQFVGETGEDGRLWTIQPDERVRVEAVADGGRVAVTVVHDTGGGV
ncbi:MAG: hypothetical protein ABEJ94_04205 [Halorientalis sp.]